ncbi:MFS transporter [Oxalobacteraceae bacterium OTU3CINTB1]|nr:MFS transporter [Oxalobacteraceae bacterium OTU3CINTB1]
MGRFRQKLTADRHLIGYSSGNFGKNLLLGSVDVTLLFLLTDLLGIAPHRVGTLMLMVFAADLGLDLGAGLLAAWAQKKGISYRGLIALGTLPCATAFGLIYSLPALAPDNIGVIALVVICFRAAYSIIDVPHNILLARVATDSRARGRASGYRTVFSSAASVVIATVLVPFMGAAGQRAIAGQLSLLGMAGGLVFCVVMFFAAWSAREEGAAGERRLRPPPRIAFLPKMDRLFGAIAIIALMTGFAIPVFTKMMLYLATYVLKQPGLAGAILITITLGQLAGAALWIYLVRSRDKTALLVISHAVAISGILCFAMADATPWLLTASALLVGIGFAGVFMLPWGILADITDFAQFRHGERRETATFATILVILKAGSAASLATVGWTLEHLGYVPGVAQPESVIQGMKLLAYGLPILGSLVAILTLRQLAIGHQAHARVVRANQR